MVPLFGAGVAFEITIRHVARWDGTKWMALGHGYATAGNTLVTDGAGHLYTEVMTESQHSLSNAIMRWDGARWEDITGNFSLEVDRLQAGRLSSNIPVAALAVDGEDQLYAAGQPNTPGGFILSWDGAGALILADRLGGEAPAVFDNAVGAHSQLGLAGSFESVNDTLALNIACWEDGAWRARGDGVDQQVAALAFDPGGDLYKEPNIFGVIGEKGIVAVEDQIELALANHT